MTCFATLLSVLKPDTFSRPFLRTISYSPFQPPLPHTVGRENVISAEAPQRCFADVFRVFYPRWLNIESQVGRMFPFLGRKQRQALVTKDFPQVVFQVCGLIIQFPWIFSECESY